MNKAVVRVVKQIIKFITSIWLGLGIVYTIFLDGFNLVI